MKPEAQADLPSGGERKPALPSQGTSSPECTIEWVPASLRKSRAIPLAVFCWVFAICLEALDLVVRRDHGLPADGIHENAFRAARYLPTIGVVALGFAWKALVSDVKNITPWSQMSGRVSKGTHSILLDYVTNVEITSLFRAGRDGHWLVFLALTIGFLCGAAVALANSLIFVDLFASTSTNLTFSKASQFSFKNTLELSNGTLPIPFDHLGAEPYAAVASQRLPNGRFAPWTKDAFAFESLEAPGSTMPSNATMDAQVQAFSSDFNCHPLQHSWVDGDVYHQLEADASSIPELNCSLPIRQNFTTDPDTPLLTKAKAWLNVTACSPNTTENLLIATIASLEENRDCTGRSNCNPGDVFYIITDTLGLVCSPKFFMQNADVKVNASTGEVISYHPNAPKSQIDIQTSVLALWLYLSNPLDAKLQTVLSGTSKFTYEYGAQAKPFADGFWIITAVDGISSGNITVDPFFTLLVDGQQESSIRSYLQSPDHFQPEVETIGGNILAEVVGSFARQNASGNVPGSLSTTGPRFFVRQASLRALQAVLIVVGCVAVMYATVMRPKSALQEDPGSLAASAVILSHSGPEVENILSQESRSTETHMRQVLGPLDWRVQRHKSGAALQVQYQPVDTEEKYVPLASSDLSNHSGWRPMALYITSKAATLIALGAIIVVFAVLLYVSKSNNGICKNTTAASNAFAFVPTAILVLIGYICSGVDGAVRTMSSYKTLWNMADPHQQRSSEKQPLLQNLRDVPTPMVPFRATKASSYGFSVTASSIAILLIPVIKIVAAGLYGVALSTSTQQVNPLVDTSLVTNLESTYDLGDSYLNVQRASQFAEWARTPSLNVPQRAGILENIVFSNLTNVGKLNSEVDLSNSTLDLQVPAISVDVECTDIDMSFSAQYLDTRDCWTFTTDCQTEACKTKIPQDDRASYLLNGRGGSCSDDQERYVGVTGFGPSDYRVIIADYGSIIGPIANITPWGTTKNYSSYNLVSGWPVPSVLNVSLPTVRATSCSLALTRITVNTTYAHNPQDSTWTPARFDRTTIARHNTTASADLPT